MYTITIDQVPIHKQALKICWTQKGPNLDQKGPKMGGAKFFRTVNLNFPKEDHKNSFYTNKTQYDWSRGKSQNSKKFSAKFKQNPTTAKNHRVFLNILGG